MNIQSKELALKYARAFLNVYEDEFSVEKFEVFQQAGTFLRKNKDTAYLVRIISTEEQRMKVIQKIQQLLKLPDATSRLLELLACHKRFGLAGRTLLTVVEEYKKRKKITDFVVSSSMELSEDQKNKIEDFLKKQVQQTIMCTYQTDETLIAGVRLQSRSSLWEDSIKKRLQVLRAELAR